MRAVLYLRLSSSDESSTSIARQEVDRLGTGLARGASDGMRVAALSAASTPAKLDPREEASGTPSLALGFPSERRKVDQSDSWRSG